MNRSRGIPTRAYFPMPDIGKNTIFLAVMDLDISDSPGRSGSAR